MAAANQVDIIGSMITEKGLTGENICREIFSYLDFSSLRFSRMVSKTWYQFLKQQRSIWMDFLRKLEPYLQYCDNLPTLLNVKKYFPDAPWVSWPEWKVIFDSIEKDGKMEDIIDTFLKIQGFAVYGWGNPKYFEAAGYWPDEPLIEPQPFKNADIFQRSWIGNKFYMEVLPSRWEIIVAICKKHELCPGPRFQRFCLVIGLISFLTSVNRFTHLDSIECLKNEFVPTSS